MGERARGRGERRGEVGDEGGEGEMGLLLSPLLTETAGGLGGQASIVNRGSCSHESVDRLVRLLEGHDSIVELVQRCSQDTHGQSPPISPPWHPSPGQENC